MNLARELERGLEGLRLALAPAACERLVRYVLLIEKWNRSYNLTAVRDPREMLARHLLDCLAIVPWVKGPAVLDLGSGAGLPGVPLALALPDLRVTLLDASAKRCAFLRQVVIELGMRNAGVVRARAEAWDTPERFDLVVSRAVTRLRELVRLAGRLPARDGGIGTMKGPYPHAELAALPEGWELAEAVPLEVPGLDSERHWIRLTRRGERG
ncbi:MAG: 16S rRNA (guanine(527)-N(7))-methyltransferase RsmG [Burkholderiales bacterium]|nr:16S rRNA (guanine(527)-N(7))-methyltransferase RsmG [Burkholderiales bacterium]